MSSLSSSTNDVFNATAPLQQESEVITDKTDKDGHHYLKVLLLSNKKTRNNWIAPYKRIGDLPKQLIDSYLNLPQLKTHDHEFFIRLDNIMQKTGISDDDRHKALVEECNRNKDKIVGYIDHVFIDDPDSPLLYGQLKVTDDNENKYIQQYRKPSFKFTSPGISGTYDEDENGLKVYQLDTMKAFHLANVPIPAFPEQEAEVKAVCMNGNSESCKKTLQFAGTENIIQQQNPTENVNNSCGCNNNIQEMSSNNTSPPPQTQPQVNTNPSAPSAVSTDNNTLLPDSKNSTQEAIEAARKEAQRVFDDNKKNNQNDQDNNKKEQQPTQTEIELKQKIKQLEEERNEKLEMKNFFLEKMLISSIPRESFKEEKEYSELKDSTKTLINKYGMSLEDADWLIAKVAKSVFQPVSTDNQEKKDNKKGTVYAGWLGGNTTTYNPDSITKPQTYSQPKPASSGNNLDDEDYPIQF